MVRSMKTGRVSPELQLQRGEISPPINLQVEDALEDQHAPRHKRSKRSATLSGLQQQQQQPDVGTYVFPVPPSEYNPLDEPSPLGLRLRKSPSLVELIQARLSQGSNNAKGRGANSKKGQKGGCASNNGDKLKASNFPASILRIGTWEYKSRYEGDLVAKCYFAKHKLVWEVLDGGLKNKIEIQWADIMALKATYPDDAPGTLDVVLARQPLFFRETNPQPRKHTLWQATSDFTEGQASMNRRHYLQCPEGLLEKHFEKLIQCDPRLFHLSQQAEISLESPYFEPKVSVCDEPDGANEYVMNGVDAPGMFDLKIAASPSGAQSSSSKSEQHHFVGIHPDHFQETPSPSSVMDSSMSEEIKSRGNDELKNLSCWEHVKVPGLHSSMSMSDLVTHIEHRMSEQSASMNPIQSNEQRDSLEILEEISRCLFSDSQHAPTSDEKSIMSRVNSLCCLLQKDPTTVQDIPPQSGSGAELTVVDNKTVSELNWYESQVRNNVAEGSTDGKSTDIFGCKEGSGIAREDSVGELLLNLPRIASLPQFCFNL